MKISRHSFNYSLDEKDMASFARTASQSFNHNDYEVFRRMTSVNTVVSASRFQQEVTEPENNPDEILVDVENGVKAKPEVNITQLVDEVRSKFQIMLEIYQRYGYADPVTNPLVITSGNDSDEHVRNSYHYKDRAVDLRGKYVPDKILIKIAKEIQKVLGSSFRVWAEIFSSSRWYKDHIHIEYHGKVAGSSNE